MNKSNGRSNRYQKIRWQAQLLLSNQYPCTYQYVTIDSGFEICVRTLPAIQVATRPKK